MITDRIGLHSVLLPLLIIVIVIRVNIVVTSVIKDVIHRKAVNDYHSWLVLAHLCDLSLVLISRGDPESLSRLLSFPCSLK